MEALGPAEDRSGRPMGTRFREDYAMAQGGQAQDKPSLYDRLGGVYGIATVVDNFVDRIMVDPRLNAGAPAR